MKHRIFGIVLVAIGLAVASASVFASKDGCDRGWSAEHENGGAARFEKHLAKLHESLKLTAAQEAAWSEFSNKMRPAKTEHPGHGDWKDMSTPDRLDRMLDDMKAREKELADHAAAVRAFYGTLTPDQQRIFDRRFMVYHHRHEHRSGDKDNAR